MRFMIIAVAGAVAGYMDVGLVAVFGLMIMLALGFLSKDVQDQSERLTETLGDHSEPLSDRIDNGQSELAAAVEVLRHELATVARQLHVVTGELVAVRVSLAAKPKGPWEA